MNPCTQPVPVEDPNGEDRWLNQVKIQRKRRGINSHT